MILAYPIDISRNFERRWQRQLQAARTRARSPVNDEPSDNACCPACFGPAPLAPASSDVCGDGMVRHHWCCQACGHGWATLARAVA